MDCKSQTTCAAVRVLLWLAVANLLGSTAAVMPMGAAVMPMGASPAPSCSMSGALNSDGTCSCDSPFTGSDCAALSFGKPPEIDAGLLTAFPGFAQKQMTWGGSPVRAADGTYHLFFSWFKMPDNQTAPSINVRAQICVHHPLQSDCSCST